MSGSSVVPLSAQPVTQVTQNVLSGPADRPFPSPTRQHSRRGAFADIVAGYLELELADKQELLETTAVEDRLRRVLLHVQRQNAELKEQEKIQSQVQEELGERQREMYLRQQMKAIQKELGEDKEGNELDELRERLKALDLPKEARAEVERELSRLDRSGRELMEAQVIRNYLEWIVELPWNKRSDDKLDIKLANDVLEADHHGLAEVKERVLEFLAVRQMRAKKTAEEAANVAQGGDASGKKARAMAKGPAAQSCRGAGWGGRQFGGLCALRASKKMERIVRTRTAGVIVS